MADPSQRQYTFLFTDIEGSTRLWEEYPDEMRVALAWHDDLLHQTFVAEGGQVFKTVGDSFYAIFPDPRAAVAAALAAQHALARRLPTADYRQSADPDTELCLRVRMAIHSGPAELRGGDYFGPALNRVARLLVAGHGGQVLLSAAAQAPLDGCLGPNISLRTLGEYRLKDLSEPEQVFQLVAPGLAVEFPPLRSLAAFQHNLPAQLTSFIGRERELSEVRGLLESPVGGGRLVTLTGPGGTGKTRLSLQVAADLAGQYHDGAWLIELAPLQDPALLPQVVAATLGVRATAERPTLAALLDYLRSKHLLLVLDNCEHLVTAAAGFAESVLRSCQRVQILTSSREALGIPGEVSYRVPSLATPDLLRLPELTIMAQYDAVRLFVERAGSVQPAFQLTTGNAGAVAQICRRLDGIPLALELAAARVKVLPVEAIASRLDDRFRLLTGGSRTALPRQQTLRALIDWSYDLLTPEEAQLLRRLAVFAGGWTIEAAEAVVGSDVLDGLEQLVNKSLVTMDEQPDQVRYYLLETIRQYARERLVESGEAASVWHRHLEYFLALAEEAAPHLTTPQRAEWLDRLDADHDNLRSALEWSLEQAAPQALRLAATLGWFWFFRDMWAEGYKWIGAALDAAPLRPTDGREVRALHIKALIGAVNILVAQFNLAEGYRLAAIALDLAREQGDDALLADALLAFSQGLWFDNDADARDRQLTVTQESLALYQRLDNQWGISEALAQLGTVAQAQRNLPLAREYFTARLELSKTVGDPWSLAWAPANLGFLAYLDGDFASAMALYEEALPTGRLVWPRSALGQSILVLGEITRTLGDLARAETYYNQALPLFREVNNRVHEALIQHNLAHIVLQRGDTRRAGRLFRTATQILLQVDRRQPLIECVLGLGAVAAADGDLIQAARLFAAGQAALENRQNKLDPSDSQPYEHYLAQARAQLDAATWEEAWAAGVLLSIDQAIALAIPDLGGDIGSA